MDGGALLLACAGLFLVGAASWAVGYLSGWEKGYRFGMDEIARRRERRASYGKRVPPERSRGSRTPTSGFNSRHLHHGRKP